MTMFAPPQLPAAALRERRLGRRLARRLLTPPPWASRSGRWALSGGVAAIVGHLVTLAALLLFTDKLSIADFADFLDSPSTILFTGVGTLVLGFFFAGPFMVSSGFYFALVGRRTPRNGALWNMGFHCAAHVLFMLCMGGTLYLNQLHVPLVVGLLWGLWLPRTRDHEGDLPYGTWLRPGPR
jgi:hypothetical protein